MYTYGQPRTGNRIFAEFINEEFGQNAFRGQCSEPLKTSSRNSCLMFQPSMGMMGKQKTCVECTQLTER